MKKNGVCIQPQNSTIVENDDDIEDKIEETSIKDSQSPINGEGG